MIHRLSSPNVLKFYDWYETRNNVWLILEFCTGGDLLTLIKQVSNKSRHDSLSDIRLAVMRQRPSKINKGREFSAPRLPWLLCAAEGVRLVLHPCRKLPAEEACWDTVACASPVVKR